MMRWLKALFGAPEPSPSEEAHRRRVKRLLMEIQLTAEGREAECLPLGHVMEEERYE